MTPAADRIALRTSLLYAGLGGLWILLSDKALELFWTDRAVIAQLQTYKGWAFVAFTAGLLYLGLRGQLRHRGKNSAELRQSEEARDRSLSLMTATLESTADGILVVNREGKFETFNRLFARMWRLPDEVLAAKDDTRALQCVLDQLSEPQHFIGKVSYLYHHPEEESFDYLEFKDGRVFERYSRPQLVGGQVAGRVWSFRDITERRLAEEQARHLENFPQLNPNPVLEFASDGALGYRNPAALTMAQKAGFEDLTPLLPPQTRQIVIECLATGQPRLGLETKHGNRTLAWSFHPIAAQRVVHCYVADITERQQLEEQLRQAQKMEAIGQLAGGVAHDFNNLLTAIIGHLGLLQINRQVTPEMTESLDEIAAAANRAANLTSQLLAFSRRQVISTTALDLNEVVTRLTKMLRRVLGEHITMQVDYAPEQLTFRGDAGLMDQVLLNLAVNARDAMMDGGTLRIVTQGVDRAILATGAQSARFVHLAVSDTGGGITPEVLPRIFEPFFTTKDVGKGTGLGLATVFGIVQQHQGTIEVESAVGRGTTFNLYLPRLDTPPVVAPVGKPAPPARGQGELILLVEDEPAVREVAVLALRQYGYQVLTAGSGREALEAWATHKTGIVLLLTDLIMPGGMSGLQLARQLLQLKPELRVIYSSGYSAEIAGKELSMKDGVNFLAKPYELDRLFRTVRAALDGGLSRPPF